MKKGDFVETIDDAIKGVVTSIENDTVTIRTEDDFKMQFEMNELVVMHSEISDAELSPTDPVSVLAEKESVKPRKTTRIKPKHRAQPAMEVDLHIHKLVNSSRNMTNHDMLNIQLDTAKRQLDFAINKRIQRVVFIHGVGDGVLRAELEYLFRRYENLKYYDADFKKYGRGATEVYIFQSKLP
jgi:dsDNA-specific endonuclease/ATPase MutS2